MALERADVARLYVSYFNRAADADGLDYWMNSGFTLDQIAQSFADQEEYKNMYPDTTSDAEFVNDIYNNLFNRDADPDGLLYWSNALAEGSVTRPQMIEAIINGAQGDDKTIMDNKTTVALDFADGHLTDVSQATSVIAMVTADSSSVDAAESQIDAWAENASTSDFTTDRDTLEGTDGEDIFNGTWDGNPNTSTYQGFDAADGKEGNDTLTINNTALAATTTQTAKVDNVETLQINQSGVGNFTVDVSNFDGSLSKVKINGDGTSTGNVIIGTVPGAAAGLDSIVDLELNGKTPGVNTVTVNYSPAANAGNSDSANITLDNNGAATVISNGIEEIKVHTNPNNQTLTLTDTALSKLVIDGAGNFTYIPLVFASLNTTATLIDATGATGNLTFNATPTTTNNIATTLAANGIMKLGSGNDTVGAGIFGGAATVYLGAGDDTATAGGTGGSTLLGEAGNDTLTAGGGAAATKPDTLVGGAGKDTLTGAGGKDIFRYDSHTDSTKGAPDTINTFTSGTDKIDVQRALNEVGSLVIGTAPAASEFRTAGAALNEGDTYVAGAPAGHTYVYVDTTNNDVYIDINQDVKFEAAEDLVIHLTAAPAVGDFIV